MMIVTTCGNSIGIARKLASQLNAKYSPLTIASFPDGDAYLRFNIELKDQTVVIVQSFQPHPDMSFFDILFAAETAKDLGAKRVVLVAPYLAYMRQDVRFHPGECVSSRVMAKLLSSSVDRIITIDTHLHRYKSLREIFKISAQNLTANNILADYIQRKVKDPVIIGPDGESYQWAESIAQRINAEVTVLEKTRLSSRHVEVKVKKQVPLKGRNVVIVDDIISTGHTMIEAAKEALKANAKSVVGIGVHGLFVENAIVKMKKAGFSSIVTTNTIENSTSAIDVSQLLLTELRKE